MFRGNGRFVAIALFISAITYLFWTSRTTISSSVSNIGSNFDLPKVGSLGGSAGGKRPISKQTQSFFDQVFSKDTPPQYDFPSLKRECARTKWHEEDVYLQAVNIQAGMTSILSQVKVAMKMALDAGVGLSLPQIYLRSSEDLYSYTDPAAMMPYKEWFDVDHFLNSMHRACPQMKVLRADQLKDGTHVIKNKWTIDVGRAPGFTLLQPTFWRGNPYKKFFESQYKELKANAALAEKTESQAPADKTLTPKAAVTEITIIEQVAGFLMFRITDDATGEDLGVWNDFGRLIRFKQQPRDIVDLLSSHIGGPYYAVHFRAERDRWTSPESQMEKDLTLLDMAWEKYGSPTQSKPMVYLACGDEEQTQMFVKGGLERGWTVTHKWLVAKDYPTTIAAINKMPFDFQGAVDFGMMIKADFYIGMTGSAFSSTVANERDPTGRYRGSSFEFEDDGARSHLDHDMANNYACCL